MEMAQTIGRGMTFEEAWAIVQENIQGLKELRESQKETERIIKENARRQENFSRRQEEFDQWLEETRALIKENALRQAETDRQMKETDRQMKETGRKMEATDKRVGELTGRFGEVVEYMIVPNLVEKFRELGFEFTRASRDVKIADKEHDIHAEIDAFLENGDKVMIVEIKSKPNSDDINSHIERMEKLREYADLKGDSRRYLGAIAGVVVSESVSVFALKNGFYVIEPSGDTFNIIEPKGKYHPREW